MLTGLFVPVLHGATEGRPDEADTVEAAKAVSAALGRLGARTEIVYTGPDLAGIDTLSRRTPDVVFNLVEALGGRGDLAVCALELMERLGLTHTGASAWSWMVSSDKLAAKAALYEAGIATPAWSQDGRGFSLDDLVIVKSVSEHASIGIDSGSVVVAREAAATIAARVAAFGGRFFAEAYVDGREFNISMLDGRLMPPAEICFTGFAAGQPRIVDWDAKWVPDSSSYGGTPRSFNFPKDDRPLLAKLDALSADACDLFQANSYARVDFRVDAQGQPWVLEVNTNPCLSPDAGFAAATAAAGLSYDEMILRIVNAALPPARARRFATAPTGMADPV
jgi:D-alanine-D-alanine ligase